MPSRRSNVAENDLSRQLAARLAGLASAGIEWVPRGSLEVICSDAVEPEDSPGLSASPNSLAHRLHELTVLAERVSTCTRCPELAATRTQTVFGVGPVGAEILFVGEAP